MKRVQQQNPPVTVRKRAAIPASPVPSTPLPTSFPTTCTRVSIFARVRPPLPLDGDSDTSRLHVVPSNSSICFVPESGFLDISSSGNVSGASRSYPFTGVLGGGATQAETYRSTASLAVGEALGGSNAVVLVYGQSGAGKTHTVFGPYDHDPEALTAQDASTLGLIPRALHDLFERIGVRSSGGGSATSTYAVSASCCQLYNDVWVDLLADGLAVDHKLTPERAVCEPAGDVASILRLLKRSSHHKALAATALNSHSSRGHTVFQAHITRHQGGGQHTGARSTMHIQTSTLTFIDLAGSERLSRVGHAPGSTLIAETRAINSSLHTLGTVLAAMATSVLRATLDRMGKGSHDDSKWAAAGGNSSLYNNSTGGGRHLNQAHAISYIPWRDSKLTKFLHGCLTFPTTDVAAQRTIPSSTLTLIVCLSPSNASFMESLSSCHFAAKALAVSEALTGNAGSVKYLLKVGNGTEAPMRPLRSYTSGESSTASTPRVTKAALVWSGPGLKDSASTTLSALLNGELQQQEQQGGDSPVPSEDLSEQQHKAAAASSLRLRLPDSELDAVVDRQRTQIGSLIKYVDALRQAQMELEARCRAAEEEATAAREAAREASIGVGELDAARKELPRARVLDRLASRASAAVMAATFPTGAAAAAAAAAVELEEEEEKSSEVGGGLTGGGSAVWEKGKRGSVISSVARELSLSVNVVEQEIEDALLSGNEAALRSIIEGIAEWPSKVIHGDGMVSLSLASPSYSNTSLPELKQQQHQPQPRRHNQDTLSQNVTAATGGIHHQQATATTPTENGGPGEKQLDKDSLDGSGEALVAVGESRDSLSTRSSPHQNPLIQQQQHQQQRSIQNLNVAALGLEDLSHAPLDLFDVSGVGHFGGNDGLWASGFLASSGLRITPISNNNSSSSTNSNRYSASEPNDSVVSTTARSNPPPPVSFTPPPPPPPAHSQLTPSSNATSALNAVQAALARANAVVSMLHPTIGGSGTGISFSSKASGTGFGRKLQDFTSGARALGPLEGVSHPAGASLLYNSHVTTLSQAPTPNLTPAPIKLAANNSTHQNPLFLPPPPLLLLFLSPFPGSFPFQHSTRIDKSC